jgi:hypothetical protein
MRRAGTPMGSRDFRIYYEFEQVILRSGITPGG